MDISWEFDVKDGYKDGIEKSYYDNTGELMEVNEVRCNTVYGLSKEYYRNGKLKSASTVINNVTIDVIYYDSEWKIVKEQYLKDDEFIYKLHKNKIQEFREKYDLKSIVN